MKYAIKEFKFMNNRLDSVTVQTQKIFEIRCQMFQYVMKFIDNYTKLFTNIERDDHI